MKNILLIFTLVVVICSCIKKKSDVQNCKCTNDTIKTYTDYPTTVINSIDTNFWKQNTINTLLYNPLNDSACLIEKHGYMISISTICNCPEIIKKWNFKDNKQLNLKISCKFFYPCYEKNTIPEVMYFDVFITKSEQIK